MFERFSLTSTGNSVDPPPPPPHLLTSNGLYRVPHRSYDALLVIASTKHAEVAVCYTIFLLVVWLLYTNGKYEGTWCPGFLIFQDLSPKCLLYFLFKVQFNCEFVYVQMLLPTISHIKTCNVIDISIYQNSSQFAHRKTADWCCS